MNYFFEYHIDKTTIQAKSHLKPKILFDVTIEIT